MTINCRTKTPWSKISIGLIRHLCELTAALWQEILSPSTENSWRKVSEYFNSGIYGLKY